MARILVVDTDESSRAAIGIYLSDARHEAMLRADVAAALAALEAGTFDLVVADISLLSHDGGGLLQAIRGQASRATVVAVAAHSSLGTAAGFQNEIFNFLIRPITREAILVAVDAAVRNREREEELERLRKASRRREEDLQRTRAAFVEDRRKLRALFENMLQGFAHHEIVTDEAGIPVDYIFLEVNEAFRRHTGLTDDIIGKRVTEVLPEILSLPFDWIGTYGRVALTGEPVQFEQYFAPHEHWYLVSAFCPRHRFFAVVFHDITDRKHAEQEREGLARFPAENPNPVLRADAHCVLTYANPAGQTLLDSWGCEVGDLAPETVRAAIGNALRTGSPEQVQVPVGDAVCLLTVAPVAEADCANLYGLDITEHLLLQGQLRHQQKLESVGTLASGVAHEINNPVNGIVNYAQLILDRLGGDKHEAEREYAGEIIRETERVATIVRNLLQFSRHEEGSYSPAPIADIVKSTLSLIRTVMLRDQITLETEVADDLPAIQCRSQQIQQVLMNLMTNARDALNARYEGYHQDKILRLTARRLTVEGEEWVRVTVEDHGTGIPPETQERMFDPFFTTKDRATGTGLGLSISHGIVRDHQGRLSVDSQPGTPTRFHLDLPAGLPDLPEDRPEVRSLQADSGTDALRL